MTYSHSVEDVVGHHITNGEKGIRFSFAINLKRINNTQISFNCSLIVYTLYTDVPALI